MTRLNRNVFLLILVLLFSWAPLKGHAQDNFEGDFYDEDDDELDRENMEPPIPGVSPGQRPGAVQPGLRPRTNQPPPPPVLNNKPSGGDSFDNGSPAITFRLIDPPKYWHPKKRLHQKPPAWVKIPELPAAGAPTKSATAQSQGTDKKN